MQIDPKFIAYSWYRDREHEWIVTQNIHRRSLTDDQRAAIAAQITTGTGAGGWPS
jgi:hypothetical protein